MELDWHHEFEGESELDEFIDEASRDPDFRVAYEDAESRSRLLHQLIKLRRAQKISQKDVACFMTTTQSAVSELEGGGTDPHLSTLQRYARALGVALTVVTYVPTRRSATSTRSEWLSLGPEEAHFVAAALHRGERDRTRDYRVLDSSAA